MRSENETPSICEETDVKVICAVEEAAEEYKDCPAACRKDNTKEEEDNNSDEVVKAGDLDVTTSGESNGKFFIGRASDLDTITLKTSEEVTISKIVLEREGYTTKDNVANVWLEDENGAKIAEAKGLDSKGQVKLTLKKDYKAVNGELNATIVVETYDATSAAKVAGAKAAAAGATIGFKVIDVESTAKNTNISGKANTYTAIDYDGSKMTLIVKANAPKEYNWTAGELYEVAKFKVNTPDDSAIVLRGFTFTKAGSLDLRKYFDKAEVTIAGEKVSGLEANVNKNDELVVSFKDYEVAAKTKAEVVVKIALTEDFDQFPSTLTLSLSDYVAVDGKVGSRVKAYDNAATPAPYTATALTPYTFKGGKVKLSNVKLGNVDAPQDAEGIQVAEGSITIPEAMKTTFTIRATGDGVGFIKQMTATFNRDDTDAKPTNCTISTPANTNDFCDFVFENVEIEKSGKVTFSIDTTNAAVSKQQIKFSTLNSSRFGDGLKTDKVNYIKYDESGKYAETEVSGSISFSTVTLQPAKASMTNTLTKEVEFLNKDSQRKVVLEGEYTAKKGDIKLNEFKIVSKATNGDVSAKLSATNISNIVTFYVFVDDMDEVVADAKLVCDTTLTKDKCTAADTFNNIEVEAGKTVKVKVEAEVETNNADSPTVTYPIDLGKYEVILKGEDANGNSNSGEGKANTVQLKVVEKGSATISAGASKNTVLKKASGAELAQFTVKPAKGASEVELEDLTFTVVKGTATPVLTSEDDLTIKVGDTLLDDCVLDTSDNITVTCSIKIDPIGSEGKTVSIVYDEETTGTVTLSLTKVNGKPVTNKFTKRFESALVSIESQTNNSGTTTFVLGVDNEDDLEIRNLAIKFDLPNPETSTNAADKVNQYYAVLSDGDELSDIKGIKDSPRLVDEISYFVEKKGDYLDTTTNKCIDGTMGYKKLPSKATDAAATQDDSATATHCLVTITRSEYADFFKIGGQNIQAFASNK